MMFATTAVLMSALTMAQAAPQEARAAQTDQTIQVTKGTRLSVQNFAGEVIVRAWDKDALRVQARHGARMRVNINTPAGAIAISSHGSGSVDYEISAPAWMPIKIDGTYNFVTVEGSQAEVFAENVRGDIVIKGGTGLVTARTIEGVLIVERARGKINLNAVNEGIRVNGATGDIVAETTNGDIALAGIESASVDVATVNGDVTYEGTFTDRGHYRFTSHNGDLVMTIPATANATLIVRSYQGDFRTALPVKGPPVGEVRQGRRNSYTLGSGSAQVELETFGGDIRVRQPGASDPAKTKTKTKDK
jgi:DUF4097 and DUF4098 domain-containing protein YvlB